MMAPIQRAIEVYRNEPCARSFQEDLEAHLLNGYVWSSPTAFGMARKVDRHADAELILNPWHVFPSDSVNAWLVYLGAGSLKEMFTRFPHKLEWIGWERENVLRWYRMDRARPSRMAR